jgi:hypothetical protein
MMQVDPSVTCPPECRADGERQGSALISIKVTNLNSKTSSAAIGEIGTSRQCGWHGSCFRSISRENAGGSKCRVLIGFNSGVYEHIDLSEWIAGNPPDVLATDFGKPAALFDKFPRKDFFITDKNGSGS